MFPGHVYRERVHGGVARCWRTARVSTAVTKSCQVILEYTEKRDFILAFKRGYSSKLGNETKNGPGTLKSGLT
jgi:hypothetical protein